VWGSKYGVETLEDMAECGKTRFARRKVKKADQGELETMSPSVPVVVKS